MNTEPTLPDSSYIFDFVNHRVYRVDVGWGIVFDFSQDPDDFHDPDDFSDEAAD